jgi:hypothetical protein
MRILTWKCRIRQKEFSVPKHQLKRYREVGVATTRILTQQYMEVRARLHSLGKESFVPIL